MGVLGLWQLLSPCGRRITLENLRGKTLAVDVSIWLTKFVKAMRDEEGKLRPNAHILGVLRRICKLIYHNITPVFVFDGGVPALKRHTIAKRRMAKMDQDVNLQHLVRRILLNKLKQHRLDQKNASAAAAEDTQFTVGSEPQSVEPTPIAASAAPVPAVVDVDSPTTEESSSESESVERVDWQLGASGTGLDYDALSAMPPEYRTKYISTFTRADKEEHRGILMSVHDDPEAFSGHQLHHFLKHAELEQRVAVLSQQGDGTKRISQEAGRRYILTQASPAKARREYADDSDDGEAEFVVQAPVPAPNEESDPFASLGGFLIDEDEPPAPLCTPVASRPPASATLAVSVSQPPASAPDHPVEAVDIPVVVIEDDEDWEEVVVAPPSSSVSLAPVTLSRSAVERQPFVKVTQQVLPQVAPAPPHADPVSCVDKVEHGREVDDEEWEEIPIEAFALPSSRPTPAPSAVPLVSSPVPPVPSFLPPARPSLPLLPPSLLPVPPSLPPPQPMEVGVASTGTALNRPATSALVPTVDSVDSESSDVEISDEQYFEDVIGLELDRELKKNVSAATGAASEPVSSIIHAIQDAGKIGAWASEVLKRQFAKFSAASEPVVRADAPAEADSASVQSEASVSGVGGEDGVKAVAPPSTAPVIPELSEQFTADSLAEEREKLSSEARRAARDSDSVTEAMRADVMELLDMFGIPFLVSPMEAEAQCAALEEMGLVDGVITDDSDVFLFGAKWVYRNIFDDNKYAEAYHMANIEAHGLDREDLIRFALLVGSDYTPGVHGVGKVNATEILRAFPGPTGLSDFKEWVLSVEDLVASVREPEAEAEAVLDPVILAQREFKATHSNIKHRWILPENFPSDAVIMAYKSPTVNKSNTPFEKQAPNFDAIKEFCARKLFWTTEDTVKLLGTAFKIVDGKLTTESKGLSQLTMDSFIVRYTDNVKVGEVNSLRLLKGLQGLVHNKFADPDDEPGAPAATVPPSHPKPRRKARQTKKKPARSKVVLSSDSSASAGSGEEEKEEKLEEQKITIGGKKRGRRK